MIRLLLFRLFSIIMLCVVVYVLIDRILKAQQQQRCKRFFQNLESADYDKNEWERIRKSLEEKDQT